MMSDEEGVGSIYRHNSCPNLPKMFKEKVVLALPGLVL